jgi:putative Holliday junction resolvase
MHPDGAEHEMTQRAKRFGNQLHGRLKLPVEWVDERYTSVVVDDQHGDIDGQAAVLILEQYFQENPN